LLLLLLPLLAAGVEEDAVPELEVGEVIPALELGEGVIPVLEVGEDVEPELLLSPPMTGLDEDAVGEVVSALEVGEEV
jgi:hypothetical protein